MLEAQRAFQGVVKQELQELLTSGTKREEAVKLLLRRIVHSTEAPDAAAVRSVMRQFQMQHDDAVRALIVKQELARLKKQGMDSFAAIEELTRKMQQREDVKEKVKEKEQEVREVKEEKKVRKEDSLSLIQRIGQVSISSGNSPERDEEKDKKFSSPARTRSPSGVDLTPQTRKRRAAFGVQVENGRSGRAVQPLFPTLKKQKLCEVGDGFLQVVTRKSKSTAATATGSVNETASKNVHKRQRSAEEDEEPVEEVRVSHHRHHHSHHHSKRHKSGSTH